eukprot:TRINITY_DN2994_c0_g1_i1.p1 TRINITY_DN2994_c0_g1~~TRINITY_DN2994_c0_g1_i1.p1  ORF type:complete len:421 (-),score=82.55 TRINITY_DN2994_c0_g1_i1:29-1291(-)
MSFFSTTSALKSDSFVRGLNNTKNTCFLNSVIQNLVPMKSFHSYLAKQRGRISNNLLETLEESTVIPAGSPKSIWPKIGQVDIVKSQFANGEQQDSSEFYVHIMDWVRDEEKKLAGASGLIHLIKDKDREPHDPMFRLRSSYCNYDEGTKTDIPMFSNNPFSGISESSLTCGVCGYKSTTYSEFFHVGLPMEGNGQLTVESLLSQYTEPELVSWRCDSCCKNHDQADKTSYAKKQVTIARPPELLCLHVQRLQYAGNRLMKREDPVGFNFSLDLSPYTSFKNGNLSAKDSTDTIYNRIRTSLIKKNIMSSDGFILPHNSEPTIQFPVSDDSRNTPKIDSQIRYNLTGIVVHLGGALGGHYVAYRKVNDRPISTKEQYNQYLQSEGVKSNKWAYVSDSSWKMVSEAKVAKAKAYMLFYERA